MIPKTIKIIIKCASELALKTFINFSNIFLDLAFKWDDDIKKDCIVFHCTVGTFKFHEGRSATKILKMKTLGILIAYLSILSANEMSSDT